MAFEVILLSRAQREISEAISWYESRQNKLGNQFLQELEEEIFRIKENPYIYPKSITVPSAFRRAVLKKFPFIVIFKVSEDAVVISSVFHTHLNPNKKP